MMPAFRLGSGSGLVCKKGGFQLCMFLERARSNLQRSRTSHPVLPVPYVREQGDNQPPQPTYHDRMLASLGSLCVVLGA